MTNFRKRIIELFENSNVNEVARNDIWIDDDDDTIERGLDYQPKPTDKVVERIKNGIFEIVIYDTGTKNIAQVYDTTDNNKVVGATSADSTKTNDPNIYSINTTFLNVEARGQGVGFQMYKLMALAHGSLGSDEDLTHEAFEVWKKLSNDPMFDSFFYNTKTKEKMIVDEFNTDNVKKFDGWENHDDNIMLIVKK